MRKDPWSRPRLVAGLVASGLALSLAVSHAAGPRPAGPAPAAPDLVGNVAPATILAEAARLAPAAKVSPALAEAARAEPATVSYLVAYSAERVDLSAYGKVLRQWAWPAGEVVTLVKAPLKAAASIAAVPGVARVSQSDPAQLDLPDFGGDPDAELAPAAPEDLAAEMAAIRAKAHAAPSYAEARRRAAEAVEGARQARALAKPEGGARPQGWFDLGLGHSTREAWSLGYQGEGVTVAVLDTAVDFGHGDMQGSWAVFPPGHPRAGWPYQFDPYSSYLHLLEQTDDEAPRYSEMGQSGLIAMYQESDVEQREINGQMVDTACLQPLNGTGSAFTTGSIAPELGDEACDFIMPASKSGHVRYGHHPDMFAYGLGAKEGWDGEFVGVLLTDPNVAGQYDTLYLDLNNDRNFTDEKPVTKDSPVAFRDLDGDGIPDLSGGLLYFIADGQQKVPGAWLFEDEETQLEVPEAYSLVGFHTDWNAGAHGTMCASNVASQGRLGVAPGTILRFRNNENDPALNADGEPEAVNPGMAPRSNLVAVGNIYAGGNLVMQASWRFSVFGETMDRDDDDIQIASNSYGFSQVDNDHWDADSRFIDWYIRHHNENLAFLVAAGNGGPGFGTITSPKPMTGMGISASTQWATLGQDSAYETSQIVFGDIVNWSDRGPSAIGGNGISVASDGAFDAGGIPINVQVLNPSQPEARRTGEAANSTFGGTSQATPMAAGNLALVYQAFKKANDRWPTYEEARALLMGGARFNGYDVASTGAGGVDTGNSVRLAAGTYGVYAMPSSWAAGDYRGGSYPGFAKVMTPGTSTKGTITLKNPGATPIDVTLHGQTLRRIGSLEEDWTSKDRTAESQYTIQAPDYLKALDKSRIPAGTDLMVVRVAQPYDQFDMNNDYLLNAPDNNWRVMVYQHTDWNDNQKLWNDANGDGIVQKTVVKPLQLLGLDANTVAIDYPQSEIEEGEYVRFDMGYAAADNFALSVHHPLERWKDGMYLALFHRQTGCNYTAGTCTGMRPESVPQSNLKIRLDFYKYQDWPWLGLSGQTLSVPAKGEASFEATMTVPQSAPTGYYQGAVFADYARMAGDTPFPAGGGYELPGMRLTIPVTVDVAARYDWTGSVSLGGAARDDDAAYNNGAVRGAADWNWRPETGDWRFFFVDATQPAAGTQWVARTTWQDPLPLKSDIDTLLYGQTPDRFTSANGDLSDPDYYGPGTMGLIARSPNRQVGGGSWAFNTSSGGPEDWIAGEAGEGLHEVLLHHVLHSGKQIELPFTTEISAIRVNPNPITLYGASCTDVTLNSQIALPGFEAVGAGLNKATSLKDAAIEGTDPNDPTTASFKRDVTTTGPVTRIHLKVLGKASDDLDLFLLVDANNDGDFTYPNEVYAQSADADSDEEITLNGPIQYTKYQVWVHGYTVPGGTSTFDYDESFIYGSNLQLQNVPASVEAGMPATFKVCADPSTIQDETGPMAGIVAFGPAAAKGLVALDVTWLKEKPAQPAIFLPYLSQSHELLPPAGPTPGPVGAGPADLRRLVSLPAR